MPVTMMPAAAKIIGLVPLLWEALLLFLPFLVEAFPSLLAFVAVLPLLVFSLAEAAFLVVLAGGACFAEPFLEVFVA